jgi:hypothetical protein
LSWTKRIKERSEAAREEEGILGRGGGGQKRVVIGGPTAIDLKTEFEIEGESRVVGRADLKKSGLGTTLSSGGQSVT